MDKREQRLLMWSAWFELNTIRARDGAPLGVYEPYFDWLVDQLSDMLGDDAKPWPPECNSAFTREFFKGYENYGLHTEEPTPPPVRVAPVTSRPHVASMGAALCVGPRVGKYERDCGPTIG